MPWRSIAVALMRLAALPARADRLNAVIAEAVRSAAESYAVCTNANWEEADRFFHAMRILVRAYNKTGGDEEKLKRTLKIYRPLVLPSFDKDLTPEIIARVKRLHPGAVNGHCNEVNKEKIAQFAGHLTWIIERMKRHDNLTEVN
jgi:hypothetical protein